jgi:hypothetical protein
MTGRDLLARHAGVLHTRVGACWPGTRAVFRGQDLHRDLAGASSMDLFLFGITGRRFAQNELRLLDGMWALTGYPDTRLWNNRVAALAANARSLPSLAMAAGIAASDARVFGGGPAFFAIDFFLRAGPRRRAGEDVEAIVAAELAEHRRILGYGRPMSSTDERLPPLVALAEREGLAQGLHYRLALEVEQALLRRKPFLKLNYAGATAALAADLGLTARQYQLYNVFKTMLGMPPCIVEASEKPEGTLMAMPCSNVIYEGEAPRIWLKRRQAAHS